MKPIAILISLFVVLAGCSAVTSKLDDATDTTRAQRCVDYQGFLTAAVAAQAASPSEARAERIVFYRSFIEAYCPVGPAQ